MASKPTESMVAAASVVAARPRKKRRVLAPSQKYEVFTATLTSSATQVELAEKYGIDRTTIRKICATAKQGALDALAASAPGRRGKTLVEIERDEALAEVERLKATVLEQAVQLHLERGKGSWD